MTPPERPTVLLPVRVLAGESVPEGIPALLANAHVVLLGYHVIPEQTAPGQARMQFEERAAQRLDELEAILTDAGATVERRLVFTHEAQTTIDRTIYEHDCLAVVVPDATRPPEDVLVAVRGTVSADRVARLVAGLFADAPVSVTLYHLAGTDETDAEAQTLLDGMTDRLTALGMDPAAVERRVERREDRGPLDAIVETGREFDAIVMGETDPSLTTFVFGMPTDQVAERFLGPVLVVQRPRPTDEE